MPRPRDPDITRIESDTYRRGYAREYKGQWVIFLGSRKIYTGLRPVPATIPKVKRRLDAEIEADMSGTSTAPVSVQSVPTLWEAVARWYDEHVEGNREMGRSMRQNVVHAIRAFKGEADISLGATPGTVAALADRFSRLKRDCGYAPNTIGAYLRIWKRIFSWTVGMGWLASNPIDMVIVPPPKRLPREKRRYTWRETLGIARVVRSQVYGEERYRLMLWQLATGMRIGETLDMRWSDFRDGTLEIRGKGYKGQKRMRLYPVPPPQSGPSAVAKWTRRMDWILREQRRLSADLPDPDRVWRWTASASLRSAFDKAKSAAGIETSDGRLIHTFRAMASHRFRHTLGFSREYTARICGHSEAVMQSSYDRDLEASEHARIIRDILQGGGQ